MFVLGFSPQQHVSADTTGRLDYSSGPSVLSSSVGCGGIQLNSDILCPGSPGPDQTPHTHTHTPNLHSPPNSVSRYTPNCHHQGYMSLRGVKIYSQANTVQHKYLVQSIFLLLLNSSGCQHFVETPLFFVHRILSIQFKGRFSAVKGLGSPV